MKYLPAKQTCMQKSADSPGVHTLLFSVIMYINGQTDGQIFYCRFLLPEVQNAVKKVSARSEKK